MNTKFLETYVLLARIGSVRRVADMMHASPGAISMRLKQLEAELGLQLFSYDKKALRLTDDGTRLVRFAESVLAATQQLLAACSATDQPHGRIRVGVIETVVHTCLPDLIKALEAQLPHVELDLTVDRTANLIELLMRNEVDLVLRISTAESSAFGITEELMSIPVHWVARKNLIARRGSPSEILQRPLLTQMRGTIPYSAAFNHVHQLAAKHGLTPSEIRLSGAPSLAALVALAREGVGVAILPGLLVKEYLDRGELVRLNLPLPPPFNIVLSHQRNASPAILMAADVARQACAAYCREFSVRWIRSVG